MERTEMPGYNFDGGFDTLVCEEDLHNEEHPTYPYSNQNRKKVFTYWMMSSRYCRAAAVSLALLAAVLLIVNISLGVHYNNLKNTYLTRDDPEHIEKELTELQETCDVVVETTNSYKKQLDSELSRQTPSKWEFEHHTKRSNNYEVKLVKLTEDVAAIKYNLPMIEAGCRHCPPGWILMNSWCYYFPFSKAAETKTWQNARDFCKMHGGDLAVIDSKDKEESIVNHMLSNPNSKVGFWIGLRDTHEEGTWKWLNGTILIEGYWGDGEPNDVNDEDCAEVIPQKNFFKTWNDISCGATRKWICEKAPIL